MTRCKQPVPNLNPLVVASCQLFVHCFQADNLVILLIESCFTFDSSVMICSRESLRADVGASCSDSSLSPISRMVAIWQEKSLTRREAWSTVRSPASSETCSSTNGSTTADVPSKLAGLRCKPALATSCWLLHEVSFDSAAQTEVARLQTRLPRRSAASVLLSSARRASGIKGIWENHDGFASGVEKHVARFPSIPLNTPHPSSTGPSCCGPPSLMSSHSASAARAA